MLGPTNRNIPYGAYHLRPSTQEDAELTHVGPGTPGGEFLRRFWQPVALTSELERPVALRVMGEELVAFRDLSGRLGLLRKNCAHRGASLEFGRVAQNGIRCCYHGWLYDVDGTVIETPGEPPGSRLREQTCQPAYPVREYEGVVFAYMGPPEQIPAFPIYDTWLYPSPNKIVAYKLFQPCNWLQAHENGIDSIHSAFLHAQYGLSFTPVFSALPTIDFIESPLGILGVQTRRWGDLVYVRSSDVWLPNGAQFGSNFVRADAERFAFASYTMRWIVPIDDTNCMSVGYRFFNPIIDPRNEGRPEECGLDKMDLPGQTGDRTYDERQREPGDWDAQTSQGAIAIHRNENLGTTDAGIVLLRRYLRRGIRAVAANEAWPKPQIGAGVVPTYISEIVMHLPELPGADDRARRKAFGRAVADIVIASAEIGHETRHEVVERRVRELTRTFQGDAATV